MTTGEKNPEQERDRAEESKNHTADPTVGTETALKGGPEAAKRQAERDWNESSKEAGE
jgi:hypothetical protein